MSDATRRPDGAPAAHAPAVARRGVSLGSIAGIRIRIDASWLLIFALVLWSLSAGYLPREVPGLPRAQYWSGGVVATLLFFASLLAHELSHSLVAIRAGIRVRSITLFVFGGVSELESTPTSPGAEMRIAIVGPLASLALAGAFWALGRVLGPGAPDLVRTIVRYLVWINAALAVFNLLPGFPLDGGRVFRAIAWKRTGSLVRATRLASDVGKGFAIALMILGGLEIFQGALIGGLWFILIGMFLRGMAEAGYQTLVIKNALADVAVRDVMAREVVSVTPDLSVQDFIDHYILGRGYRGFPVVDGDRVCGLVSLADVKDVPPAARAGTRVAERMRPLDASLRIGPEAPLSEALQRMASAGAGRLVVMRGNHMDGVLTRTGLARFLELRRILDESAGTRRSDSPDPPRP
jgi:Zn-dependent protease/predicted transcriptional regulator